MQLRHSTIGLITLFLLSTAASAGPDILPGLWENKAQMSSKSGQIEAALEAQKKMLEQQKQMLANMPAEQRKMMEDMMAKQMGNFDPLNQVVKTCLTQNSIDNFDIARTEEGCSQSFEEESKDHYVLMMKCEAENMSGRGDFHIHNNKSYTGTIVMEGSMNGQSDTITIKQEGTWVSSDCGDVAPQ